MLASRLLADGLLTRPDKASEAAVLSAKPSGACSRSTAWSFEGEGQPMAEPENGQGFVTSTPTPGACYPIMKQDRNSALLKITASPHILCQHSRQESWTHGVELLEAR
jgi:hypothetical protein